GAEPAIVGSPEGGRGVEARMDAEAIAEGRGTGVAAAGGRRGRRGASEAGLGGWGRAMRGGGPGPRGGGPRWGAGGGGGGARPPAAALPHAGGPAGRGEFVRIDAAGFPPERRLPAIATVVLESVERLPRGAQAWWLARLAALHLPGAERGIRWLAT